MTSLSAIDAFFVAYQQSAGLPMHIGVDLEIEGPIDRPRLVAALAALVERWPEAACRAQPGAMGLRWGRPCVPAALLVDATPSFDPRNDAIEIFHTPAMQLHWRPGSPGHQLSLRAHHALFDGEGFMAASLHFLDCLAAAGPAPLLVPRGQAGHPTPTAGALLSGLRERALGAAPYARAPLREEGPGPVGWCSERAPAAGPWRAAAAWMRALGRWTGNRRPIALEMPHSLRRWRSDPLAAGNHVAPMILHGRGDAPLDELAARLEARSREAVTRGELQVEPLLASPGVLLPWPLFCAAASSPTATGNATGHLAYLRLPFSPASRLEQRSAGALRLLRWQPFTPVCLRMGTALLVIESPEQTELTLLHRHRAVDPTSARTLLEDCREAL